MNNYTEITWVDGTVQGILFGGIAFEEFIALNLQPTMNTTLQTCNIIYCGVFNYAASNRKPAPDYADIIERVDELLEVDPGKVWAALGLFNESRFGKKLTQTTEHLKKKAAEESQSQLTPSASESSPTES